MRTKKVNRYYCDYCKKSGCSAGHMKRHESACTANPNRVCRVCKMVDAEQKTMPELLAVIPKRSDYPPDAPDEFGTPTQNNDFIKAVDAALPALREAASNCPACILAALRQSGVYMAAVPDFNFQEEMAAVWAEINQSECEKETIY